VRICIDLDGVICKLKEKDQTYADLEPVPGAMETLKRWRTEGHHIIIHTARHMKTCQGNVGQVVRKVGTITLDWLDRHEIEYDEIYFGKPWAEVYIDDNAFRFENWEILGGDTGRLPVNKEKLKTNS
jgi:capsule biosynthesis phosphatase